MKKNSRKGLATYAPQLGHADVAVPGDQSLLEVGRPAGQRGMEAILSLLNDVHGDVVHATVIGELGSGCLLVHGDSVSYAEVTIPLVNLDTHYYGHDALALLGLDTLGPVLVVVHSFTVRFPQHVCEVPHIFPSHGSNMPPMKLQALVPWVERWRAAPAPRISLAYHVTFRA